MKTSHRPYLLLLLVMSVVVLAACSVNVQTKSQDVKATAEAAIEQEVATSVAATKVALETALVVTTAPIPPTDTPVPPTDTPEPPTATPAPTEATTPNPLPTLLPKITVLVPTHEVLSTVVLPVVTLPVITPVMTLPPFKLCNPPAATSFQKILDAHPDISSALGCPTGINPNVTPEAWEVQTAFEPFEHGMMIWSNKIGWYDQPVVYVLYDTGGYQRVDDTFQDGVDPESGGLTPPPGLYEPIRGFGKVWRDVPYVSASLGWATAPEVGGVGRFQIMEGGEIIWLSETGHTYVFVQNNMRWYEFDEPFQP